MKSTKLLALVLVIMALAAGTVFAAVSGAPTQDTYVDLTSGQENQPHNANDLRIQGSSGPAGGCDPVRTVFMKWNLADLTQPAGYADLKLTTIALTSQATGRQVTLYRAADNWDENVTANNAPAVGDAIQTLTLPGSLPAGTVITFGNSDGGLLTYINSKVGQPTISVALRFASCAASSTQGFEDRESGAAGPQLSVKTAPNAVAVAASSAERTSWPLYAGLAAVALVVVAGVMVSKRRTA